MNPTVADLSEMLARFEVVDLSPTLERGIPRWPTHPHLVIDPTVTHEHDGYYCQTLSLAEHTGAHVDVPAHMLPERKADTVDTLPPGALIAPAVVYNVAPRNLGPGDLLSADDLLGWERAHNERAGEGEIALLHFGWMRHWRADRAAQFYATNAPGLDESAVKLLADRGVRAVGADTIAVDTPLKDGVAGPSWGHTTYWLPRGILIIEELTNLDKLPPRCLFIALPLKIKRGSGSPIRPVALIPRS
ncbi:MAG: cyclase family protein [Verrucomicrobiae bacterium]|nr:cyclase family protein [Verrucomicrobiae bacterium]